MQSYTAFGVGPSRVVCPKDMGDLEEVDLEDEIIFNIEADLEANDTVKLASGAPRCSAYWLRYPLGLALAKACIDEVDESNRDTHL